MSAANIEVVRAQYEAWKRGAYREALAAYDESVEWDATHFPDDSRPGRSKAPAGIEPA